MLRRPVLRAPTDADTIPGSYVVNLIDLARRLGVSRDELLAGSPVRAADLNAPQTRVPLATMNALVSRARRLTGEPGLGVYMGLQKRISIFGYLGFAIMTAASLRECLELAVRFTPMQTPSVALRLDVDVDTASLVVEWQVDMGDLLDVATLSLVVGLAHVTRDLTGRAIKGDTLEFEMPEPAYYHRFAHRLPRARFGQPATRIRFPRSMLDLPLATADRGAMLLARAECERALEALLREEQLGERVRRALAVKDRVGSCREVAAELGLSSRTLVRHLRAEGLTFSELVERERRARALDLLRKRRVSLEEVSERLSYSTVPSFIRAFKRWTGMTPSVYRRTALRGAGA
jgi:AraC-like DNA-binding protein